MFKRKNTIYNLLSYAEVIIDLLEILIIIFGRKKGILNKI